MSNYERYQLQWMLDHGFSLADLIEELDNVKEDSDVVTSIKALFDTWEFEYGFGSEIWACEDEWRECEGAIEPTEEPQRIVVPLANGYKIVAEQNTDPNYETEIFIGVLDKDDIWTQDLAIVRQSYSIGSNYENEWKDDEFDICVYSDVDDEDYTHKFVVSLWQEDSFTAFAYEDDGTTADLSTYDDKEEAIDFAKSRGWDEVVNDITGEVVWRNNHDNV